MSKCWRCNKEFYNSYGYDTLCDECLGRQPKTTTIDGLSKRIFEEKLIPSHCLEQYEKYEKQLEEKDKEIERLKKIAEIKAYQRLNSNETIIDGVAFTQEQIYVLNSVGAIREYNQNQKTIEELENIKNNFYAFDGIELLGFIENRIAELKGEK